MLIKDNNDVLLGPNEEMEGWVVFFRIIWLLSVLGIHTISPVQTRSLVAQCHFSMFSDLTEPMTMMIQLTKLNLLIQKKIRKYLKIAWLGRRIIINKTGSKKTLHPFRGSIHLEWRNQLINVLKVAINVLINKFLGRKKTAQKLR